MISQTYGLKIRKKVPNDHGEELNKVVKLPKI